MKNKLIIVIAMALLGCAPNYYQPYSRDGYGYSEVNTGKNKYEIMFHGSVDQDEMAATQYAIIRTAEVGKQNSFSYFRIVNSKENEHAQKIIMVERESDYGRRGGPWPYRRRGYWGPGYEERITSRVERRTTVKLVVEYQNEDCNECLSVDGKLQEAVNQKIIK